MLVLIALNRHKYLDRGKNISIKVNNKKIYFWEVSIMVFTASNGIKFRDKDDTSFVGNFIAGKDKTFSIFLVDDIILSFENGRYQGSYQIPF